MKITEETQKKYKAVFIVSGNAHFPCEMTETVSADSLEEALQKIKNHWAGNYMHCEFLSVELEAQ